MDELARYGNLRAVRRFPTLMPIGFRADGKRRRSRVGASARTASGMGNLDLATMVRALPPNTPLSLEAPTKYSAKNMTAIDRAKRGRAAVDALLALVGQAVLQNA